MAEEVTMSTDLFGQLVRQHNLAVETLTEQQLAEVIRQAIASGDIMRNVVVDRSDPMMDGEQSVTYIPFREVERLRSLYHELIYAVGQKHDGETRHETALREDGEWKITDMARLYGLMYPERGLFEFRGERKAA